MEIITSNSCHYTVVFEHPDVGVTIYNFFVKEEPMEELTLHATEEEEEEYYTNLCKKVWNKYNKYGYYHTMSIVGKWVIDGKAYLQEICTNESF